MSEQPRLDETTYESSRILLQAALENMLEAGRSVRELSEYALDRFGHEFLPYLRQFLHEVGHGRISIVGLSPVARQALAGHTVSIEERDRMIREAAYLRAERRGFCGGSAEQDWLEAEHEIDVSLAQGPGLIVRGGHALAAVADAFERELAESRQLVTRWLQYKFPVVPPVADGQRAARTPKSGATAKTRATAAKTAGSAAGATKRTPPQRAAAKKKAAAKPASAKQPARATTARKKTAKKSAPATTGTAGRKQPATRKPAAGGAGGKTTGRKRASKTRR
ncbi:MAG: DUF2934 domain-containing protein [Pseudomonadota bacterium]